MTYPLLSEPNGFGFIGMILLILMFTLGGTLVLSTIQPALSTSRARVTAQRAEALREALQKYKATHGGGSAGSYPASLDALVTDDSVPCAPDLNTSNTNTYLTLQGWCGPYIDRLFAEAPNEFKTDGWGSAFQFNSGTGILTSCGPDRSCGTSDDITFSP